jgi:phage replication-related protein YjqB (UPF0714/DUF867 family)
MSKKFDEYDSLNGTVKADLAVSFSGLNQIAESFMTPGCL